MRYSSRAIYRPMTIAPRTTPFSIHAITECTLKLLYTLVGEYLMKFSTYLIQVVLQHCIAAELSFSTTHFINIRYPKVHIQRILWHTAGHQLTIITQYIATSGRDGNTICYGATCHLAPIVAFKHHHQHCLDQNQDSHQCHKKDDGEIARNDFLIYRILHTITS